MTTTGLPAPERDVALLLRGLRPELRDGEWVFVTADGQLRVGLATRSPPEQVADRYLAHGQLRALVRSASSPG